MPKTSFFPDYFFLAINILSCSWITTKQSTRGKNRNLTYTNLIINNLVFFILTVQIFIQVPSWYARFPPKMRPNESPAQFRKWLNCSFCMSTISEASWPAPQTVTGIMLCNYTLLTKVEYLNKSMRQLGKGNSLNQHLQSEAYQHVKPSCMQK